MESEVKFYHHDRPFELESGEILPELVVAYHTYGKMSAARDNVIWVCHALTANSDVADWWPHTVEEGKFLDPSSNFIVCANILGSHYGTTGPLHVDSRTGHPYYSNFPRFTIRDMVAAHKLLANHLKINRIKALIGSSVGGFQAVEWAVDEPHRFDCLALIATDAVASPWTIAVDETQRMAIMADPTYGNPSPDAGMAGLAAARAIGLLTYRGPSGYNASQRDPAGGVFPHRASTYQQYQGSKLCKRYNAYSYVAILDAFDTHDVSRGRGPLSEVLARITIPTIIVGITTDIIFTPTEMRNLAAMIPGADYCEIESAYGHDGFLIEHGQLNEILKPFIDNSNGKDC